MSARAPYKKPKRIASKDFAKGIDTRMPKTHGRPQKSKTAAKAKPKSNNKTRSERRKADVRMKRLQQQLTGNLTNSARERIESQMSQLQRMVESTYAYETVGGKRGKRIRTKDEVARNVDALSKMNTQLDPYVMSSKKSNRATEIEIAKASAKETEGESKYSQLAVHMFYNLTRNAWDKKGLPIEGRNQAILESYGYTSLSKLFDDILKEHEDLLGAVKTLRDPGPHTQEELDIAHEIIKDNFDELIQSPNVQTGFSTYLPPEAPNL